VRAAPAAPLVSASQQTLDALAREHPYPVLTRLDELRPVNVLRRFVARRRRQPAPRR